VFIIYTLAFPKFYLTKYTNITESDMLKVGAKNVPKVLLPVQTDLSKTGDRRINLRLRQKAGSLTDQFHEPH
jgi:hypothetical protein